MNRDDARRLFQESGLDVDALSPAHFARLRFLIDKELRNSGLISGSFRAGRAAVLRKTSKGRCVEIHCQAYYFDKRQAVTFDPSGFIGFAGWADDVNVAPILAAFRTWVDELIEQRRGTPSAHRPLLSEPVGKAAAAT